MCYSYITPLCIQAILAKVIKNIHGPQRINPTDFDPKFSHSATMRLTFVVLSEMSQQLLDVF